ncbi:MAG: FAD binding domain-containing protein [Elusimicrobia bacterium]|nr:FAD binding domain-containing protein [Elusimicrobiota bacterium]
MSPFTPEYIKVRTVSEIREKIPGDKKAYFLAGGTDLMCYIREGLIDSEKSCLVDISKIDGLNGIEEETDRIVIGAMTTFREISENESIKKWCPGLALAARSIGTPQIANRATIGGNIGNASPSGDSIPSLITHNAVLKIAGSSGEREVDISGIFTGPKKTILANAEIITSVLIPKLKVKDGSALRGTFIKIGGRKSHIISKASVAVLAAVAGRDIGTVNVAFGAVGPVVINAESVSRILENNTVTPELMEKCAVEIRRIISPIDDFRSSAAYRREVLPLLFARAMDEITG